MNFCPYGSCSLSTRVLVVAEVLPTLTTRLSSVGMSWGKPRLAGSSQTREAEYPSDAVAGTTATGSVQSSRCLWRGTDPAAHIGLPPPGIVPPNTHAVSVAGGPGPPVPIDAMKSS